MQHGLHGSLKLSLPAHSVCVTATLEQANLLLPSCGCCLDELNTTMPQQKLLNGDVHLLSCSFCDSLQLLQAAEDCWQAANNLSLSL